MGRNAERPLPTLVYLLISCTTPPDHPADDEHPFTETPIPELPEQLPCEPAPGLVLNEVSPSNVAALVDIDGDTVDWIEVFNPTAVQVDLEGWSLTDDPAEGPKWTFPELTGGSVTADR